MSTIRDSLILLAEVAVRLKSSVEAVADSQRTLSERVEIVAAEHYTEPENLYQDVANVLGDLTAGTSEATTQGT